jgi:hypothetical protein
MGTVLSKRDRSGGRRGREVLSGQTQGELVERCVRFFICTTRMASFPSPRNRNISVLSLESASGKTPRERYFAPWRDMYVPSCVVVVMQLP